jgi:hypothetical protein
MVSFFNTLRSITLHRNVFCNISCTYDLCSKQFNYYSGYLSDLKKWLNLFYISCDFFVYEATADQTVDKYAAKIIYKYASRVQFCNVCNILNVAITYEKKVHNSFLL